MQQKQFTIQVPSQVEGKEFSRVMIWDEDGPAAVNYAKLGEQLSRSGDLFRTAAS